VTPGVKRRLIAFLVLSAVGIVYVSASYLGFVDKVLGRGYTLHADLPESGGLYVGSAVTYRGVQVGEVSKVDPTDQGIAVDLAMQDGSRIPLDAPFHVHNLTAVGEQYLDFEPVADQGPFAAEGDTFHGTAASLPVDEGDLLVQLDQFVNSVDKKSLQVAVRELGLMFHDTGQPLETLLDEGTTFIDQASAHEADTVKLLHRGLAVLHTQQEQGENIRALARDLRLLTGSLKAADSDLRTLLQASPAALHEVNQLIKDLGPTMPTLLGNLITDNSVVVSHLAGVEQLLVTFPRVVSSGFSGTPANGWGRISLQTDNSVGPCRAGYLPPSQWRRGDQTNDTEPAQVRCASGPPYNMRGANYAPGSQPLPPVKYRSSTTTQRGSYDPATGRVYGAQTGKPASLGDQGDLSIFGGESWKWLVISPVMGQ
jgi:phospholipid/cholesterol/gamma-HCH transport system substrate-binding protein